jgi:peroxiredoxin
MLSVGAQAPVFTLADLSGEPKPLKEILTRGPVLLALFKISCPTCQMTMPFLERLAHASTPGSTSGSTPESMPESLQIVGISQDDARATARFSQTFGITMTTLLDREDDGYPVSNAFGITHVPSLFLVEMDGTISVASNGFSKPELEAIGLRAGGGPFRAGDNVPEWKAG